MALGALNPPIPRPRRIFGRPRWLRMPRLRGARKAKVIYEKVIVFDHDAEMAYMQSAPRHVLQAHLDHRARFIGNKKPAKLTGLLLGWALAAPAWYGFWVYLMFLWEPVSAVFALVLGAVFGGLPGWMMGRWFGPRPVWLMRAYTEYLDARTGEFLAAEQAEDRNADDIIKRRIVESIIHRRFTHPEIEFQEQDTQDGKAIQTIPRIFRANNVYRLSLARDAKKDNMGEKSTMEKFETAMVAMIALASVGLFILYAITLTE